MRFVFTRHGLSIRVLSAELRFAPAPDAQLAGRLSEVIVEVAPTLELLRGFLDDFVAALLGLDLGFIFDWLQRHEFGQALRVVQSPVMLLVHPELGCYLLGHVHILSLIHI